MTANGHGLSISGDDIVLKLIVTMIAQLLNTVKSIGLYTRNGYMGIFAWYMNYRSIKLFMY